MLVLPQAHVHLVGEGEAKEDGSEEHLDGDEEVLVGGGSDGAQQVEPLQDGQEEACGQREEIGRIKELDLWYQCVHQYMQCIINVGHKQNLNFFLWFGHYLQWNVIT